MTDADHRMHALASELTSSPVSSADSPPIERAPTLEQPALAPPPWGPWATLGWMALATVAFLGVTIVLLIVAVALLAGAGFVDPQELEPRSLLWLEVASYLVAGPVAVAVLFGAVKWRRWSFRQYVALRRCSKRAIWAAAATAVGFLAFEYLLNVVLDRPIPEFLKDLVAVPAAWPIVALMVIVAAPLVEEIVFRGFMYRGLAASRLGVTGAILLTSLAWSLVHVQYEWLDVALIFVWGMLLGWLRYRSGSIWPCIALHLVINATALGMMMIYTALGIVQV